MEYLDTLAFLGFLLSTMLSLGLQTEAAHLRALFSARSALLPMLLANFAIAPLLGVAIVRIVPLPAGSADALLILACVPGGLSALQFTRKQKGHEAVAGAVIVLLSVLAVFVSPLLVRAVLPGEANLEIPYLRLLGFYALFLLAPLGAGMLISDRSPRLAAKLTSFLGVLSAVLFIGFMLLTKSFRKEAVASVGGAAVGAMLVFILATMVTGWLLGGPQFERRHMLASTTSMRNAALALAVARESPEGAVILPSLIAFSLLMVPPNTLLMLWGMIRARRAAGASGKR
jgi:BASS family bile acid:Na+ symporter